MRTKPIRLVVASASGAQIDFRPSSVEPVQHLVELERQWTHKFLETLRAYDPEDRQMFRFIVAQVLSRFATLDAIATYLGMNSTSVMRWASGDMVPPKPHRASVVAQLTILLEKSTHASVGTASSYFQAVLEGAAKLMEQQRTAPPPLAPRSVERQETDLAAAETR